MTLAAASSYPALGIPPDLPSSLMHCTPLQASLLLRSASCAVSINVGPPTVPHLGHTLAHPAGLPTATAATTQWELDLATILSSPTPTLPPAPLPVYCPHPCATPEPYPLASCAGTHCPHPCATPKPYPLASRAGTH